MSEFKRVLLSKNIIIVFLLLCFFSAGYELFGLSGNSDYRDEYQNAIEKYAVLSDDERQITIESEHKAHEAYICAYYLSHEEYSTEQEEKIIREKCEELLGSDYEFLSKKMDLSESEFERVIRAENALEALENQLDYINKYPAYLDAVHANAQKGSLKIFAKNEYNRENSLKTDADYPKSDEIQLCLTPVESFNTFVCGNIDVYCYFILIFAILLKFSDEKKRGLAPLVYCCKNGRAGLTLKRVAILAVSSVCGCSVISLCRLLACIYRYGNLPDLTCPVQSSPEFGQFVFRMTFGQVLIADFILKVLGLFSVGMFFWVLMLAIRSYKLSLIISGAVFIVEYSLFYYIPDSFNIVYLRFANIFALIDIKNIYLKYLNINLFGYPVSSYLITFVFSCLLVLICATVTVAFSELRKPVKPMSGMPIFIKKAQIVWNKLRAYMGLTGFELRKLLVHQRGSIICVLLLFIVIRFGSVPPSDDTLYDSSLAIEAGAYTGEITRETIALIDDEIVEIENWKSEISRAEALKTMMAFRSDVQSKYEDGRGLWLLNQAPYASLFGTGDYRHKWGLIAFAFVVLLVSGLFPYEKQSRMTALLLSTKNGRRKVVRSKILISLLSAVFVWACISGSEIFETYRYFGNFFNTLQAPLASIDYFREKATNMTIGLYFVLHYLARLLCLSTVSLVCCVISLFARNTNNATIVAAVILLFPGVVSLLDVPFAEYCSFIRLWSPLESDKIGYIICAVLIPALMLCIYKYSYTTMRKAYK